MAIYNSSGSGTHLPVSRVPGSDLFDMANRLSYSNRFVAPTLNHNTFFDLNAYPKEQMGFPWEVSCHVNEKNLKLNRHGSLESVGDNSMSDVGKTLYRPKWQMKIGSMSEMKPAALMSQPPKKGGPQAGKPSHTLVVRPEWLPVGWGFTWNVRTAGKLAGRTDKYFFAPSGQRFRSKVEVLHFLETGTTRQKRPKPDADATPSNGLLDQKQKTPKTPKAPKTPKVPSSNPSSQLKKKSKLNPRDFSNVKFDFRNPPRSLTWVQADDCPDDWLPVSGNATVPESERAEWEDVCLRVTQLDTVNGTS